MGKINVGRWLASGVAATMLIWVIEGAASMIYMEDMQARLSELGLSMDMTTATWVLTIVVSLLVGLVLMFLYVAARPRFGAGPKTAVIAAVAMWLGGYVVSLIGYYMVGLYAAGMLALWGVVGLVELILAALLGGWIYREAETTIPAAR